MPASPFLPNRGHLCKDNIATAKTAMIPVGGGNLKQAILARKTKGEKSGRKSRKDMMFWIYACHWVSAAHSKLFKKLLKCNHQTELTPLQGCNLAFEQQGTQLASLQSLEAPCSAAIPALGWKSHSFLTIILNFSRYLTHQGNNIKVKKKTVFLLLLISGQ